MDQNDNIEKFFNKKFAAAVSEEDWNTPPDDTWGDILVGLEDDPTTKPIAYYFPWLIGIILLIFASYLLLSEKIQNERIDHLENQINTNKIGPATGNIDKSLLNGQTKSNSHIVKEAPTNEALIPSKLVSDKSSFTPISQSSNKSITGNNNDLKTNIKSLSLKQQITPKTPILNSGTSTIDHRLSSNVLGNMDNNSSIGITISNEQIANAENSQIFNTSLFDSKISSSESVTNIGLLAINLPFTDRSAFILDQKPNSIILDNSSRSIYVGLVLRYNQWSDKNSGIIANPLEELLTEENTLSSVSYGFSSSINLSKKWTGNIDLLYNQRSHQSSYFLQLPFSTANEVLDTDGDLINAFQHSLPTSLGDVQTDVTLARSQSSSIENDEIVGIDLSFKNQTQSILIPLSAAYFLREANNGLYFSGGLTNEIVLNSKLSGIQSNSHHSKVDGKTINIEYDDSQQNKYGIGANLGLGYVWKFKAGTNVKLGANYDFALSENYGHNGYQHKTNNFSVGVSLMKLILK